MQSIMTVNGQRCIGITHYTDPNRTIESTFYGKTMSIAKWQELEARRIGDCFIHSINGRSAVLKRVI